VGMRGRKVRPRGVEGSNAQHLQHVKDPIILAALVIGQCG
jgi:hypothetical protein